MLPPVPLGSASGADREPPPPACTGAPEDDRTTLGMDNQQEDNIARLSCTSAHWKLQAPETRRGSEVELTGHAHLPRQLGSRRRRVSCSGRRPLRDAAPAPTSTAALPSSPAAPAASAVVQSLQSWLWLQTLHRGSPLSTLASFDQLEASTKASRHCCHFIHSGMLV